MANIVKKIVIGASVAASMSLATAPALAAGLTGIDFGGDTDFRTYRSNATDNSETFSDGDVADAIDALTDNDVLTHVELATSDETGTARVGFTAELGGYDVSVESVTATDWVNDVRDQWISDFSAAYPALSGFAPTIADASFTRGGDANIGSFTQDDTTGEFQLDLIGHLNVLDAPWIQTDPSLAAAAGIANILLGGAPLQVSEIAKVTIDGEVHYAYSFDATDTGFLAADGSSHSGLYSWTLEGEPSQDVPEPSAMLAFMALGGFLVAKKRKAA